MSNIGKFIDRSPRLCKAGVETRILDSVSALMKFYPTVDDINALKHECNIPEVEKVSYPAALPNEKRNYGYYTRIRDIISPPSKTTFEDFEVETFEKKYDSVKNRTLGQPRKALHKPENITNFSRTFGIASTLDEPVYETILPRKSPNLVLCESQVAHQNYIKSHNDYNAGEQIRRPYCPECFDIRKTFGERYGVDMSGKGAKRCMEYIYYPSPICVLNQIQGNYRSRTRAALGEPLEPNKNKCCLSADHVYGKKNTVYKHGVRELLRDCEPCSNLNELYDSISHINVLRRVLNNREDINFNDLMKFVSSFDPDNNKYLPKEKLFHILSNQNINVNQKKIEFMLKYFNMMNDEGLISYIDLIKLLDKQILFPELGKIRDIPIENQYYSTTYRDFLTDNYCKSTSSIKAAGIPSRRTDKLYPETPYPGTITNTIMLGNETTSETLISPSIPVTYGVSHRDYFLPRSKKDIHCIFTNIGYDLTLEEFFNDVYERCNQIDKHPHNFVCVNTFKVIMEQLSEDR